MKKRTLILAAMVLSLSLTGCGSSITQTKDAVTVEAGEELSLNATDFFDISEDKAGDVSFDLSGVDVNTVGTYEATAAYKNSTFTITVTVEDTTAPAMELSQGYAFTNDIASCLPEQFVGSVQDVSDYTLAFTHFEKSADISVLDDVALAGLAGTQASQEELAALSDSTVPTEEGIYRAVIKAEDAYGNAAYAEASIILDTTAPSIEYTGETSFVVEDISQEPEIDMAAIVISDNADGDVPTEEASVELTASDEEGSYNLHVAYTDRAGNTAEFPVTITAKVEESNSSGNMASNSGGSGSGGSGNGSSGSGGGSGNSDDSSYTAEMRAVVAAGEMSIVRINDSRYGICSRTASLETLMSTMSNYLYSISLSPTYGDVYYENGYTFLMQNCQYNDAPNEMGVDENGNPYGEGVILNDW